jgi:hypothetical protein
MQTIEIRLRKKPLIAFMIFIVAIMIGTTYYIFIAKKYANSYLMKFIYVGLNAQLIYSFSKLTKRLKTDKAVIILSRDSITIEGKDSDHTYNWKEVQEVSISDDDSTSYLTLKTL